MEAQRRNVTSVFPIPLPQSISSGGGGSSGGYCIETLG